MGNLLDRIRASKQAAAEAAETERREAIERDSQEIEKIAIRDLLGKATKKDVERLDVLMKSLDYTEDDYEVIAETLKSVAVLVAKERVYQEAMHSLAERAETALEQRRLLETLSRRLFEPVGAVAWMSDQLTRIKTGIANVRNKVAFIFDEDGSPNKAIKPLIEKELERQAELWSQRIAPADAIMKDSKFFAEVKKLASQ